MAELNKVQLSVNGISTIKAVQFTEPNKEQVLAINKYLGAQAFQEHHLETILDSFEDGDTFTPLFYKDGASSWFDLKDWLYVKDGEVYSAGSFQELTDIIIEAVNVNSSN